MDQFLDNKAIVSYDRTLIEEDRRTEVFTDSQTNRILLGHFSAGSDVLLYPFHPRRSCQLPEFSLQR